MSEESFSIRGVSVVTATYNEKENLPILIARIRRVLSNISHEIVVVDDSSPDGTYEVAHELADLAIMMNREGQTKCLLTGIKRAKYPAVVTIDADLENPPELIPILLREFLKEEYDILVASRCYLPRISEVLASKTIGKLIGVSDVFSNFRVYKRECVLDFKLKLGETFGGELLAIAWKRGYKIGEYLYEPPPRRKFPRIGGRVRANLRIIWALVKVLIYYI